MSLPRIPDTAFTERAGVNKVAQVANNARCVWRETLMRDVGIDGQIEYVDAHGNASGRAIAIQVKSGRSYFERGGRGVFVYQPSEQHRRYWEAFPLPVIVVLYDPTTDTPFWVDARAAIRDAAPGPLRVPIAQVFDERGLLYALESEGPLPSEPISSEELLELMLERTISLGAGEVSFFDLFFHGLTNAASWAVYFGMDLLAEIAEAKQVIVNSRLGYGVGPMTFDCVDRYVAFLVAYDLARVDFDWFSRLAREAKMVGVVLAPLTERGQALVDRVADLDAQIEHPSLSSVVVQERAIQLVVTDALERARHMEFFKCCLPELLTAPET